MADAVGEMFICSKIRAKSFRDGSQDICKGTESNLGPVAGQTVKRIEENSSDVFHCNKLR